MRSGLVREAAWCNTFSINTGGSHLAGALESADLLRNVLRRCRYNKVSECIDSLRRVQKALDNVTVAVYQYTMY
jgi:hypothetical protein